MTLLCTVAEKSRGEENKEEWKERKRGGRGRKRGGRGRGEGGKGKQSEREECKADINTVLVYYMYTYIYMHM